MGNLSSPLKNQTDILQSLSVYDRCQTRMSTSAQVCLISAYSLLTSWILRATWTDNTRKILCSGDTDKMASSWVLCCLLVLFVALVAVEAWSGWVKWHFFNFYTVWRVRFYTWSLCSGDTDTMSWNGLLCCLLVLFVALVAVEALSGWVKWHFFNCYGVYVWSVRFYTWSLCSGDTDTMVSSRLLCYLLALFLALVVD